MIREYINYLVGPDRIPTLRKDTYELIVPFFLYQMVVEDGLGKSTFRGGHASNTVLIELVNSVGEVVSKYSIDRSFYLYHIYTKFLPEGRYHLRHMNGYTVPLHIVK